MLINGKSPVTVRRVVALSTPRYVETALYGKRIPRVPCYRRAVAISAPRYMDTAIYSRDVARRVSHYRMAVAKSALCYVENALRNIVLKESCCIFNSEL